MPIQCWGKIGVLAYFSHLFWDSHIKFVFPIIYININKGQTQLEVNYTQIDHSGLQKPEKWPYLKTPFWPSVNGSKFFGGLNKKYASYVICKIHIYIDFEGFRQIHWKM